MSHASFHCRLARAVTLAAALSCALPGCGPSDPLEAVRIQQDSRGDFAGSIEALRELMEERPDEAEVQLRYGLALVATGNASQAIWSLKKAMASPEWRERAGLSLAEIFVSLGNFDDAIETYDLLLQFEPDSREALLGRALAGIRSRRHYEASLADADRALELDPDDDRALVFRGMALLGLERADEAAEVIDQLEGAHRDDSLGLHGSPAFCAVQASFADESGKAEQAEERYEQCLALFPNDPVVVEHAVKFFDKQGGASRAAQILGQTLEAMPANHNVRSDLVNRALARGDIPEAERLLRGATQLEGSGDAALGWSKLGLWQLSRGELEAAVQAFERARQLAPAHSPELAFAHADSLVLVERYDEAQQIADETGIPAYQQLVRGRVALLRGDPKRAFEHLAEGVRLWPDNAIARYYLAVAAEQLDDFAAATEHYRAAMRVEIRATDAYLRLARIHEAAGRLEQAMSILGVQPGGRPSELTAGILHMEILARLGIAPPPHLTALFASPETRALGVAAAARGFEQRQGAERALEYLRDQEQIDYSDPIHAAGLEALVETSAAAGRLEEGRKAVEAALAAHPHTAVFHALRGRVSQLAGAADGEEAAAHYERALELEADQGIALRGSGALAEERGDFAAALTYYERARAADPADHESEFGATRCLAALERHDEARTRLEALLRDRPFDAQVALALARLRLQHGDSSEETLRLARRAVGFQGGADAAALVEKLQATTAEGP